MSSFTYERHEIKQALETYEWDNVWIDHANDLTTPRVLYVGDSISCGTRRIATQMANDRIYFDGFGTSKALDNPFLCEALFLFAKQQPKQDAVIINNGLHGWHLDDEVEYPQHYRATLARILDFFGNKPVFLVLTTSVADAEREKRVQKRNQAVLDIAKDQNLPVIDLYSVSVKYKSLRASDGVHFTQAGYEKLAEAIVDRVKSV